MKKKYQNPALNIARFSGHVCTAAVSGITDGINLTEQAIKGKDIESVEKAALSTFSFVY